MKIRLIVRILGASMFMLIGVLLPMRVFAADSGEKAYALAEEDCKKIAAQLGEKTPANLYIGGTGLDTYSVGCGFTNEGSPGYATQQIEDIQININMVGFSRRTLEAARNLQAKKASSKDTTEVSKDGFVKINRGTPDGSEYILKGYLVFGWPELRKTHTAEVSINKGTCGVSVTARSRYKDKYPGYHVSGSEAGGEINKHPGFNHDREAEMLALARKKAEEIFSVLDCSNNISSPLGTTPSVRNSFSKSDTLNKSNYTQALVIEPPKESDFQKVKPSDFQIVYPESTSSATVKPATESANITGSIFIGKVGGEGELILQLPDEKEVELKDDKTAFEAERPNVLKWRGVNGSGRNYTAPKRHVYINEVDCHLLLEQEKRDKEALQRLGIITYASDWSLDDRVEIKSVGDCSYLNKGGPVRVSVEQGQVTFKTLGDITVTANKADFGVGYNSKSDTSIAEVYNGSVTVTNKNGQSKTISTVYGSDIKRIETDKDGGMTEKIAIPLSEWEEFLASNQKKEKEISAGSNLPIVPVILVLGVGGLIFFLYRTGKLLLLYKVSIQKISELMGKNSKGEERK